MDKGTSILRVLFALAIILSFTASAALGQTGNGDTETRERTTDLVVSVTEYEWWVIRWTDNRIQCQMFVAHDGLPTGEEILSQCGKAVYDVWRITPPCEDVDGGDTYYCYGVYLHPIGARPAERTIQVELPPPSVWISLAGCTPTFPDNRCLQLPSLLLEGEEPLPNESISTIRAELNGSRYTCNAPTCEIPLRPTTREGMTVTFYAESTFGDRSETFTAMVRVIDSGVSTVPGGGGWYVDVISSQWRGAQTASCAQTWKAFPPIGGPPAWLTTPEVPELLATNEPYQFLAGKLISRGVVNAGDCPGGGLLPNGYADACGMERAQPYVQDWQNQFDARIIEVANQTGVPAQLMKNLFGQESQFWPGAFQGTDHLGLGHMTENGAEVLLLWNRSFFDQFCPLVLDASECTRGYIYLDKPEQAILRGALAMRAEAECPQCPAGIDLSHANFTVELFAQALLANCEQVGQIVYNATAQIGGQVAGYEDLWRLTLANYHAGPGCLSYAVHSAWAQRRSLTWDTVSGYFTPACQGVIGYVNNVAR